MTTPLTSTPTHAASYAPPGPSRTAAELAAAAELGDDVTALLRSDDLRGGPREFLSVLIAKEQFAEATRFLAHALPRRECVWWAWVCARKVTAADAPPQVRAALDAAERWIVQPTEEHRRAAMERARAAQLGTPAGCAALSAFFTGGSLGPPEAPVIPPGEFMTAKAAAGAVMLAALVPDPPKAPERFREFLALGLEVAERTKLWT
jgi:hypothetical protein